MMLVLFVIAAVVLICLLAAFVGIKYREDKRVGPLPHQHGYDYARQDRVLREEAAKRNRVETILSDVDISNV